jgi:F-type H+-transporting ATPase subunit b
MEIDAFTLAAQVVNFLLLLWLLNKFLFKRVAAAMDAREVRVKRSLEEAELISSEARALAAENVTIRKRFEERGEAILEAAREKAEELRSRLMAEAESEAERARENWRADLAAAERGFLEALRARSLAYLGSLAAKALGELADESLEKRIVDVFAKRLAGLEGEGKDDFRRALGAASGGRPPIVRSSFRLDDESRALVAAALAGNFSYKGAIEYLDAPTRAAGIELAAEGYRISWSLEDYLDGFEERLRELFERYSQEK